MLEQLGLSTQNSPMCSPRYCLIHRHTGPLFLRAQVVLPEKGQVSRPEGLSIEAQRSEYRGLKGQERGGVLEFGAF